MTPDISTVTEIGGEIAGATESASLGQMLSIMYVSGALAYFLIPSFVILSIIIGVRVHKRRLKRKLLMKKITEQQYKELKVREKQMKKVMKKRSKFTDEVLMKNLDGVVFDTVNFSKCNNLCIYFDNKGKIINNK